MDPKIIKQDKVIVDTQEIDDYGNLKFTDTAGNSHKIAEKRNHLFNFIQDGRAVELFYAKYMDKLYITDVKLVEGELPEPAEAVSKAIDKRVTKAEIAPQERGLWWKEIGELIRADKLEDVFGEKDAPIVKRFYKLQAILSLGITAKKEEPTE